MNPICAPANQFSPATGTLVARKLVHTTRGTNGIFTAVCAGHHANDADEETAASAAAAKAFRSKKQHVTIEQSQPWTKGRSGLWFAAGC